MIRTQLYLPEDLRRRLRLLAQQARKPEAEVIRELLQQGIAHAGDEPTIGEGLLRLAKVGEDLDIATLPPDLSARIDDELYGDDA
jgi:predicted DNA-binding protein